MWSLGWSGNRGIGATISYSITPWDFTNYNVITRALSHRLLLLDDTILGVAAGYALIGFIAGLALYARGRTKALLSVILADIAGAMGIIWGLVFAFSWPNNGDLSEAFTHLIFPNVIVSLVLLPILFGIYIVVTEQVALSPQRGAQRDHKM